MCSPWSNCYFQLVWPIQTHYVIIANAYSRLTFWWRGYWKQLMQPSLLIKSNMRDIVKVCFIWNVGLCLLTLPLIWHSHQGWLFGCNIHFTWSRAMTATIDLLFGYVVIRLLCFQNVLRGNNTILDVFGCHIRHHHIVHWIIEEAIHVVWSLRNWIA